MTVAPPSRGQEAGPLAPAGAGAVKLTSSQRRSPDYRPIAKQAIGLLTLFTWRPVRSGCVGRQRAIGAARPEQARRKGGGL